MSSHYPDASGSRQQPNITMTRSSQEVNRPPLESQDFVSNPNRDHALPSVEPCFSCSSSSAGRFTPLSSSDEIVNTDSDGLSRESTAPNTRYLFQNLNLNDGLANGIHEPLSNPNSTPAIPSLTPNHATTTYRDLYNATPTPSATSVEPSQKSSSTPTSPSPSRVGTLSSGLQNLILGETRHASGEEPNNEEDYETEGQISDSVASDEDYLYNIRQEELPHAPIYDIRLQNALKEVRDQLTGLTNTMGTSKLAHEDTATFHDLYKNTLEASRFAYPTTRTVGFIGDSGVGKSSLINSLLDQEGLARSSGDGAACTTVVTEFRSVDDTHPQNYTIEADFMNATEMRDLLEELLRSFRKYYTSAYREVEESEEQENTKAAAIRARDTLRSMFPNQPDLDHDFLSQEGQVAEATILETLEGWATAGLDNRPGGRNALRYSVVAHNADECMNELDNLTTEQEQQNRPAIWPFVKLIRVYLKSLILRTGLVLADLPGFRDLNYARVMATERYLRHHCDEVFIVTTIIRCTTDKSISKIVERCAKHQPIRIVCTRSEEVDADETARTSSEDVAIHINNLTNRIQTLEKSIRNRRSRRLQTFGSGRQKLAAEETTLRDEKEELVLELKQYLITRRNRQVTESLSKNWDSKVQVFCVSNKLYSDHREDDREQANEYIDLSGITELRRYCQLVPADAQLRVTKSYLENQLPALLGSLTQWALAGSDIITARRAEILHGVLTKAERTLQLESQIRHLETSLKAQFNSSIIQTIRNSQGDWKAQAVQASSEWATWHHTTYAAFCRHYGTYSTDKQPHRCWNEEILQPGLETLTLQWNALTHWLEEQIINLEARVSNVIQTVCSSIEEHICLAPDALGNLLVNIEARKRCIIDIIRSSCWDLIDEIEHVQLDAMGGHNSSYIAGVMRPAYNACVAITGTGSHVKRKEVMYEHLKNSRFLRAYSKQIDNGQSEMMARIFGSHYRKLQKEVRNIARDLKTSITVEGEIPEAGQDRTFTEILKGKIDKTQVYLNHAQRAINEVSQEADD